MKVSDLIKENQRDLYSQVRKLLSKSAMSENELADCLGVPFKTIRAIIERMRVNGLNLSRVNNRLLLHNFVEPGGRLVLAPEDRGDGWTVFGFITDNHKCNRHHRQDVEDIAYQTFADEGVHHVLNAGNWIDGEARFNRNELEIFGMDDQLDHWASTTPRHKGITTHFISGDDHEGWYSQRERINIGQHAEDRAKKLGREDLHYLGHVESDIELKGKKGSVVMRLMHPGGGSSYAFSYAPQKIVESFQGGEKPTVLLIGHYHKWDYCVPLSAEILTRSGWKSHRELIEDEEVLGYNPATDRCEWTRVLAINVFRDRLVRRYSNKIFDVRCTPDHRWALIRKFQSVAELGTIEDTPCQPRIVQAAPAPSGAGLGLRRPAEFLARKDGVSNVLQMTSGERRAFILGMMYGEGTLSGSGTAKFAQNPGPVSDAFGLACFLEGIATSIGGSGKRCVSSALLTSRFRETRALRVSGEAREDVWCPTTGLGTWVMRQERTITITGNCYPREVHVVSGGCAEDQSTFMRKLKIAAHVGFSIIKVKQNPNGTIAALQVAWYPFYDRGYYKKHY